jgi:hypothetical protein
MSHARKMKRCIATQVILPTVSLTNKLADTMNLCQSREVSSFVATEGFPSTLSNHELHYRAHKSPALVTTLGQVSVSFYLSTILLIIINPSTS